MHKIDLKNISNKNYEKLRNCLFKIVLGKGHSLKKRVCLLTKGHLNKPEGQVEVESPLIRSCF